MYNNIDITAANLKVQSAARRAGGVIELTIDNTFNNTDNTSQTTRRVVYRLDENSRSNLRIIADTMGDGLFGVYGLTPIMVVNNYTDRTGNYCQPHQDQEIEALKQTLTGFDFQLIEALAHTPEWTAFKMHLANVLGQIEVGVFTSGLMLESTFRSNDRDAECRTLIFDTIPLISIVFKENKCTAKLVESAETSEPDDNAEVELPLILSTLLGDKLC